jgi:hypothetical protein
MYNRNPDVEYTSLNTLTPRYAFQALHHLLYLANF